MADDRKQYAKKVVLNIIQFMAQAGAGIIPSMEQAESMLGEIPEELHDEIIASLMAARTVKEISMMEKLSSIFPIEEALKQAMEKSEEFPES